MSDNNETKTDEIIEHPTYYERNREIIINKKMQNYYENPRKYIEKSRDRYKIKNHEALRSKFLKKQSEYEKILFNCPICDGEKCIRHFICENCISYKYGDVMNKWQVIDDENLNEE